MHKINAYEKKTWDLVQVHCFETICIPPYVLNKSLSKGILKAGSDKRSSAEGCIINKIRADYSCLKS